MYIQVILSIFLLFALSRVVLQVRTAKLTISAFLFWTALFILALAGVLDPNLTSYVAKYVGIGRGTDIVLYLSIVLLFYLVFRLSISLEEVRREVTKLVRKLALEEQKRTSGRKKS